MIHNIARELIVVWLFLFPAQRRGLLLSVRVLPYHVFCILHADGEEF
jgi:hypothetical protein